MIQKGERFPVFRLSFLVILVALALASFGSVPQNKASFERVPFAPVLYYFAYFSAGGILLLLLAWFCVMVYRGRITFNRTPLDIPIALMLVYTAIRIPLSSAPYAVTTELLKQMVLAGFFYFVVNNIKTRLQTRYVVFFLISAAFLICVYGLVNTGILGNETVLGLRRFAGYGRRISATYICPNHFAGLLEIMIPFAVSYILISRLDAAWKLLIGVAGILMFVGIVLSMSRSGWAALVAAFVTIVLLSLRKVKVPSIALIIPSIVTAVVLVFLVAGMPTLSDRVTKTLGEEDTSYASRKEAWLDTLKMAKSTFLIGSGPGTYKFFITRYQSPGSFVEINYAHNDYLQTVAEYGIIGLGIVVSMVVIVARAAGKTMNALRDHDDFAFVSGFLGAFIAISIHSLVDFNMHISGNAILMMVLLGTFFAMRRYSLDEGGELELLSFESLPGKVRFYKIASVVFAVALVSIGLVAVTGRYLGEYYHHLASQQDVTIRRPMTGEEEIPEDCKQEVVENYLKAYRFDTSNPAHAGALANVYVYQSQRKKTYDLDMLSPTERFRKRLEMAISDPDYAKKAYNRIKKAVRFGEEAVLGNPLYGRYHVTLAEAYRILWNIIKQAQDFPLVIDAYDREKELVDEYSKRARLHFNLAVKQHPNSPFYNEALMKYLLDQREYQSARTAALRTARLLEGRASWKFKEVIDTLSEVANHYLREGNYRLARTIAIESITIIENQEYWRKRKAVKVLVGAANGYFIEGVYKLARETATEAREAAEGEANIQKIDDLLESIQNKEEQSDRPEPE